MDVFKDEDRVRRLQILEKKIRDPRSVSNVDSLLVSILTLYFDFTYFNSLIFTNSQNKESSNYFPIMIR